MTSASPAAAAPPSLSRLVNGYHNWSRSVRSANRVYRADNVEDVWRVLSAFREGEPQIRVTSGRHDYGPVTVPPAGFRALILDLGGLKGIQWDSANKWVGVEPGVTLREMCEYLEHMTPPRTIVNSPTCQVLTAAGCFMMASHGSGTRANWVDQVAAVEFLSADGATVGPTPKRIAADSGDAEEFRALAGSMGALGVVTRVWVKTTELYKLRDTHQVVKGFAGLRSLWAAQAAEEAKAGTPGGALPSVFREEKNKDGVYLRNLDMLYWTPMASSKMMYFRRRQPRTAEESVTLSTGLNAEPTSYYKVGRALGAAASGAVIANGLRHWGFPSSWLADRTAAEFSLVARSLGEYNTLAQLNAPITDVAVKVQERYAGGIGDDCEIFFPVKTAEDILDILGTYEDLFRLIMGSWAVDGRSWADSRTRKRVEALGMGRYVKALVGRYALYTSPVEVRFLPSTTSCLLAPNYKRDCLALSVAWMGSAAHHEECRGIFRFFLRLGALQWRAVPHWGKMNMLDAWDTQGDVLEIWREHFREGRALVRKYQQKWDPRGRFSTPVLDRFFAEGAAAPPPPRPEGGKTEGTAAKDKAM